MGDRDITTYHNIGTIQNLVNYEYNEEFICSQCGEIDIKIYNNHYDMNNLPEERPDVVGALGINNLSGWCDWYINYGSKGQ